MLSLCTFRMSAVGLAALALLPAVAYGQRATPADWDKVKTLMHAAYYSDGCRQGAEALAQRMTAGGLAHAERVLVNMLEGKMFVEFRADSRQDLETWLETEGMHFDFLVRIEWEMQGGKLQPAE